MSKGAVELAWPVLFVLLTCSRKTFQIILKDSNLWKIAIRALVEIAFNYLYEEVSLTRKESREIGKNQKCLEKLAARGGGKSKKTLVKKRTLVLCNINAVKRLISPLQGSLAHLLKMKSET